MSLSSVKYDTFPPPVGLGYFPEFDSQLELTEETFVRRRMRQGTPNTPVGISWLEKRCRRRNLRSNMIHASDNLWEFFFPVCESVSVYRMAN